jgi:chaperonin GroES
MEQKPQSVTSFQPSGHRLLVRFISKVKMTSEDSKIELENTVKNVPNIGEVTEVGTGHFASETGILIPVNFKRGDKILFGENTGLSFPINGENLLLLDEGEVLGIV